MKLHPSPLRGLLLFTLILGPCIAIAMVADAPISESPPAETQPAETQPTETQPAQTRPAETQPATRPRRGPATDTAPASAPTTTTVTSAATTQPDRYLAVLHGRVHTVTGPVLERATVLAKNGVISAIGTHVPLPPDCEVVDAAGRFVYPGLIAPGTSGIFGSGDPRDTTDLFGLNMTIALAGGITAVLSGNDVAKLTFGTTDGLLVKRNVYWNLNYSTRNPIQRAELRAGLERVRNYLREVQRHEREKERNPEAKAPDRTWLRGEFEQYRRLLARETIAVATANDSQALRDLATLARQYDFALVIRGAAEGWLVAPELSRAGARVILTPRDDRPPDLRFNRPTGSTIENARILSDHGVLFGILPGTATITLWGLAGRDLLHLNMEAAFAVRGGLPNEDALRSLTIDAARILGVDDRLGSLEVGKDADLIITDGDILHYMTQVHIAVVHGRVAYRKADETLFAHIRPQGERTLPEFDDQWPRRLEWPQE